MRAPIPLCSGASGPFDFSMTVEHAPFDVPIKRGSPTPIATTVASSPASVRVSDRNASLFSSTSAHRMYQKMDVRRSPVPWMRFVAIPPPPSGTYGKSAPSSPAGTPKRVRSISPMSPTTDGLDSLVLGSPVSPLISDTTPVFTKIRFLPLPPAAVAQPSNHTGHDRPMENSPSPHHQDCEVTSAQHTSNIEDEVEAEAGDSLIDGVIAALYRHVEALKEHTSVLEDLIVTLKQTRN
ncbi:hypothetical protein D6D20_09538 [Aureobasidium pullulans]|uniref:Uncharacterized protein n=1 Tax=Aureobasidium pullulans TaxID=5580 RepID=A0A4S8YL98_AURPU|nr:hypothetical protein D6D26_06783 [Aureobasidium pullulans]THW55362.1 hypothetical protein D6D20_09538 [Aureobasidium pullulans]THZ97729.1 hypothetical protein D6C82_06249 [Aureobasidium pullulans]